MIQAAETQPLTPELTIWQAYDPSVKADLFSTALRLDDRLYLVDPIPLAPGALEDLTLRARICSVILTNANHARAAGSFAARSGAAILASAETASVLVDLEILAVDNGDLVGERLQVVALPGAAEGEIALHCQDDGGSLILGDALINFEPNGFALLPARYCTDQKLLRSSLRHLLDFSFERLLFAHGTPILSAGRPKLEALLANC